MTMIKTYITAFACLNLKHHARKQASPCRVQLVHRIWSSLLVIISTFLCIIYSDIQPKCLLQQIFPLQERPQETIDSKEKG